jgi:hypothetical protein
VFDHLQCSDGRALAAGVAVVERRLQRLRAAKPEQPLLHPASDFLVVSPDGVLAADFCWARDALAAGEIDQAEHDRYLAAARRLPPTGDALLVQEGAITSQFRELHGLAPRPGPDDKVPLFTDPRRPAPSRSLAAAAAAGVRAGGKAVSRSKDTMAVLQSLYDRVAVRSGRVLDRHALVHSVHALSPAPHGRDVSELYEEVLLDLRDLHLFLHGAFADAVVRMPSAPAPVTSLPLVGAGAAAASATVLAGRKQLGSPSTKGSGPSAPSSTKQSTPDTPGSSRRAKLGTPKSSTPDSAGRSRLGGRHRGSPPPLSSSWGREMTLPWPRRAGRSHRPRRQRHQG